MSINYLDKVSEFHKKMNHPIISEPKIPDAKRGYMRISLIQEELNELKDAFENDNKVEILDAFCDLQYVLSGAILEFGMQKIFDDAFNEVHRSNMTKLCKTIEEAKETKDKYLTLDIRTTIQKLGDGFIVLRVPDRKQLKSINYSPTELRQFLEPRE